MTSSISLDKLLLAEPMFRGQLKNPFFNWRLWMKTNGFDGGESIGESSGISAAASTSRGASAAAAPATILSSAASGNSLMVLFLALLLFLLLFTALVLLLARRRYSRKMSESEEGIEEDEEEMDEQDLEAAARARNISSAGLPGSADLVALDCTLCFDKEKQEGRN